MSRSLLLAGLLLLPAACGFTPARLAQGRAEAARFLARQHRQPDPGPTPPVLRGVPATLKTADLLERAEALSAETERWLARRGFRLTPQVPGVWRYGSPDWERYHLEARLRRVAPAIRFSRTPAPVRPPLAISGRQRVAEPVPAARPPARPSRVIPRVKPGPRGPVLGTDSLPRRGASPQAPEGGHYPRRAAAER